MTLQAEKEPAIPDDDFDSDLFNLSNLEKKVESLENASNVNRNKFEAEIKKLRGIVKDLRSEMNSIRRYQTKRQLIFSGKQLRNNVHDKDLLRMVQEEILRLYQVTILSGDINQIHYFGDRKVIAEFPDRKPGNYILLLFAPFHFKYS